MKSTVIDFLLRAMRETLQSVTILHIKGTSSEAGAFDIAVGNVFTKSLLTHTHLTYSAPAEDHRVCDVAIVYGDPRMEGADRSTTSLQISPAYLGKSIGAPSWSASMGALPEERCRRTALRIFRVVRRGNGSSRCVGGCT